ncbi:glycine betaine ABC transporter substrate-binding protein [Sphingomonas sp. S2-65]|uniref:glycine betaine ABC transporter substrate-binding protein n=1 Tax=Sphingomonas sp. S2-65 TaxID=2903960 RepID=UPI001F376FFE|nr:glycine betaine ABC transporter substrate-binding protein [Sphingomonas sp. S2-65]UYY58084.1 glycine betaine ABC transporter substrate-binding protein [Sphingomonas sp. S2-65]
MSKIRVGHIDLGFHDASAREVEAVLVRHGHEVERSAAPHEDMFRRMGQSEIDMLVSAWLPSSHGAYLAPFENEVRKITVLYEPFCIWGVPHYVPANEVAAVEDLLHAPAVDRMERLIQGINPGAGISRFSKAIVEQYGLDAAGYHFETGTEAECFERFEAAVAEGRWVVVPLWHPQFLHARHEIRALSEPKGLLGGTDQATLIVRRDAEEKVGAAALDELSGLKLGNAKVSELEDRLVRASP